MKIRNVVKQMAFLATLSVIFYASTALAMFVTTEAQKARVAKSLAQRRAADKAVVKDADNNARVLSAELLRERAISKRLGLGKFKKREYKMLPVVWVWVNAVDGTIPVEEWKINQMRGLRLLLADQKTSGEVNSANNALQARPLTKKQLVLLSHAFDAIKNGEFNNYYADLENENKQGTGSRLLDLTKAIDLVTADSLKLIMSFPRDIVSEITAFTKSVNLRMINHINIMDDIEVSGVSPSGLQCVVVDKDKKVSLVDMETGALIDCFTARRMPTQCLLNRDSSLIFCMRGGNTPVLYDVRAGAPIAWKAHYYIFSQFSPDGNILVCAHNGTNFDIVKRDGQRKAGVWIQELKGNDNYSWNSLKWSQDGKYIIGSLNNGYKTGLFIYDVDNQSYKMLLEDKVRYQWSSAILNADNSRYAYASSQRYVIGDPVTASVLYEVKGDKFFNTDLLVNRFRPGKITFSENDAYCFVEHVNQGGVLVIDLQNLTDAMMTLDGRVLGNEYHIKDTAFSPDGTVLVEASGQVLSCYESKTGHMIQKVDVGYDIQSIVFSADGNYLIVVGKNNIKKYQLYTPIDDLQKLVEQEL